MDVHRSVSTAVIKKVNDKCTTTIVYVISTNNVHLHTSPTYIIVFENGGVV